MKSLVKSVTGSKRNARGATLALILLCGSLAVPAQGIINHPARKAAPNKNAIATKPAPPPKVMLFEYANYQGERINLNTNSSLLPPPLGSKDGGKHGNVSSLKVNVKGWVVFWEGKEYNEGEDQLWVEGPAIISDLSKLHRPHGNNHWGDRIRSVSFASSPPIGDNNRRTIISRRTSVR
ncbi:MAG: hypothetical protein ABI977_21760 [Acidobacteriota bacterium]